MDHLKQVPHPPGIAAEGGHLWRAGLYTPQDNAEAGYGAGGDAVPNPASNRGPNAGAPAGVVQLSHAQVLGSSSRIVLSRFNSFAERYGQWRERASVKFHELDLAPNLAEDIGSIRWFRGMGTMFGLAAAALLFWPNFTPLEAAQPMRIDDATRDEYRSQMIMPLALGGDSGRHMAATRAVVPLKSAPERPSIEVLATLAQGDSFVRMLRRAGVGAGEADDIASRVASAMPLADIQPGTKVDIILGRRGTPGASRPLDALSFRARFDLEIGVQRGQNGLALEQRPIRVDATPLRIRGKIGPSLYRSARAAGAPAKAVQQFLRVVSEQTDLSRALAANDEFDLIVSYKRAATGEVETGDLLYAGVVRGEKARIQLMRWGKDGRYYEASGVGEQRSGLLAPVPGRTTSGYGMRRHPILGYKRMHRGLDFKASYGQPIYAVSDGTVQFAGRHGGHGNFVKLSHSGGLGSGYAHMSRIAVHSGQRVRQGQVIGYVGSTGLSTGPHLHYEMYRAGKSVDPAGVKFVNRAQLSGQELQNFKAQLGQLLEVEPGAALQSLAPTKDEVEEPAREIERADHPREVD